MSVRVVDEGLPFLIHGADRAFLAQTIGRSLEWREDGVVVWSLVGHLRLPSGTSLVIRSAKAPLACVLSWAAWVDPALADLRHAQVLDDAGDTGDVATALARVFCRELLNALGSHGLRRRYRQTERRDGTLRGAINFNALASSGGDLTRTPCTVWERLPRTPLNHLLSAAVERLRRDPLLRLAGGARLSEARALLTDVPPFVDEALLAGRRPLERDERPFAVACALARLVVQGSGLSTGVVADGLGFLVPLDALFEKAVVQGLREAGLSTQAQYPAAYQRLAGGSVVAGGAFALDSFVTTPRGGVVIDAKYKRKVDAGNLQQMVAYCHLLGVQRAVLVYPAGLITDRRCYVMPSPTGPTIQIDIAEMESSGRSIVEWRDAGRRLGEQVSAL
jgi:hypothetical protein